MLESVTADKGKGVLISLAKVSSNRGKSSGRKQLKGSSSKAKGGSKNRFDILLDIDDNIVYFLDAMELANQPKQQRKAAKKFTDLMNTIKPKSNAGRGSLKDGSKEGSKTAKEDSSVETRVKENNSAMIVNKHIKNWSFVHNYIEAINRRIWLFWKRTIQAVVVAVTAQSITIENTLEGKAVFVIVIYTANEGILRRNLCSHLLSLQVVIGQKAWLLAGDFNVLLNLEDCSRMTIKDMVSVEIREFRECIEL
ncbi:hypothetical protein PTKIN_Ptkin14bG0133600 [Pterospermum kingtungense]